MAARRRPTEDELDGLARECDIEFTRAGGPGGQHRNKTETAVRVSHRPSGLVVLAAEHRSQARNKRLALERLADKLAKIEEDKRAEQRRRSRRKTRPSKAAKRRRLDAKRQRGATKQARRRPRRPTDD